MGGKRTGLFLLAAILVLALLASCGETASPIPTSAPTSTAVPTREIAQRPTQEPTSESTAVPTTLGETLKPTLKPTAQATGKATPRPTRLATREPAPVPTRAAAQPAGDQVLLQLRLQEGEVYRQRVTTEQVISQTLMGTPIVITQVLGFDYSYDVEDVDAEGNMWIQVTYDRVSYRLDTPLMGDMRYDSADPSAEPPPGAELFAALVGTGFRMRMAPNGQVLEIAGIEEMIEEILDNMSLPPGTSSDDLEETLRASFGEEAQMDQMATSLLVYPDQPLGIGDSWQKKQIVESGELPIAMDSTWTVQMRRGGRTILEVYSSIEAVPQGILDPDLSGVKLELSGEQRGTMEVDESTGWVVHGVLRQRISGQAILEEEDDPSSPLPGGMSWGISLEGTIMIEVPED